MTTLAPPPAADRLRRASLESDPRPRHGCTVEEYLAFEQSSPSKHEYYAGNIYAMTGASRSHILIVTNLVRSLANRLADRPCEVYASEMRLKVKPTGLYTYPDVTVVCGEPQFDDAPTGTLLNPQLVIEVLSKSTKDYDLGVKFDHYREVESLLDYLLVSQDARHVELRSRPPGGEWAVTTHEGLDAVVTLKSLDCDLPLSDIYRRINFSA